MLTGQLARLAVRQFFAHPWQVGLAILGIALGVVVAVSIDLANSSALRAFRLCDDLVTQRLQRSRNPLALGRRLEHDVRVADPNFAPMYAQRSRKVKTDRRDAPVLAEASVLGAYRPARRLSDDQRHVRGRLTVRDALVRTRTGSMAVIRSLRRQHGDRARRGGAEAFLQRVREVPLPGRLRSEIAPRLAVMRQVNQQLAYSDERIEAMAGADERVRLLRSVPSVGPVTAAAFVAALDDVKRFRWAHEVEAYLGLVPRALSSGESHHRGRITKAGSSRVRRLLVQAAVSILRLRDPRTADLREWALGIAARRGKKVAVVALARRLAGILYAMLRDGTRYEPRHPRRQQPHRAAASTAAAAPA